MKKIVIIQMFFCVHVTQVRGFAPIGMVEWWNIGKMGLGILQYWVNGKIRHVDKV